MNFIHPYIFAQFVGDPIDELRQGRGTTPEGLGQRGGRERETGGRGHGHPPRAVPVLLHQQAQERYR